VASPLAAKTLPDVGEERHIVVGKMMERTRDGIRDEMAMMPNHLKTELSA
jgi:hypothetical protein